MVSRIIVLVSILDLIVITSLVVLLPHINAVNAIQGLHVSGNQILDGTGHSIHLYGVNRAGADYTCIHGLGIWDGPMDSASIAAIAAWHVNVVRIPVNEDCWLGINGVTAAFAGHNYQQAIVAYVNMLNANGIAAVIDLQFNAPGATLATTLNPMPDADHAPAFWQSVATTFKGNNAVLFDLLNEPFPDNAHNSTAAWTCWKDGGTCPGVSYQTAGMQALITIIRGTGATNIITVGGLQYSNTLDQWLAYRPNDPTGNLVASWHVYDLTACNTESCWNSTIGPIMLQVPVIAGEIGESDCSHGFIDRLMTWLDAHGGNYLGWTWNAWPGMCSKGPTLITDYNGTPTNYGMGLKNHFAALAARFGKK